MKNLIEYALNALAPTVIKYNRYPITYSSLKNITGLKEKTIKDSLNQMSEDILVRKNINGAYTDIEIIKPIELNKIPEFIFNNNISQNIKNYLLYFYQNYFIDKTEDQIREYLTNINYKTAKTYFSSKIGNTAYYSLIELLSTDYELVKEFFKETSSVIYDLGDNVDFSEVHDCFIYGATKREPINEQDLVSEFIKRKWKTVNAGATKRNIFINISEDDLLEQYKLQDWKCYYTDRVLTPSLQVKKGDITSSVDRIDNTKGYIKGNIVICDNKVNAMKSNLSLDEFYELVKLIHNKIT